MHENVSEIADSLGADFDGGGGGDQRAVADDDVLGGTVFPIPRRGFQADGVICAFHVAAEDADVARMIDIDAVGVCGIQRIQDAKLKNTDVVAACNVERPEGRTGQRDVPEDAVVTVLCIDHGRARVEIPCDIVGADPSDKGHIVSVDRALSRNGDVLCILCVEEDIGGLERDRSSDAVYAFVLFLLVRAKIGIQLRGGLKHGSLFQMQVDIASEHQGRGVIGMAALQKNGSAAGRMAVVDRVLDGRRVIGFSVSCGAVFCCRVIGADVHVTDPHFLLCYFPWVSIAVFPVCGYV